MGRLATRIVLKDLIRIPSITGDAAACQKIIEWSQLFLRSQKVQSEITKTKNRQMLVWGETNLSKSQWLVNSHLDVVPGKPEQFMPQERNGKMWGRGSADTKSSVAILLSNAFRWQEMAKNKHITFMLVTNEEVGGESTKELLKIMKSLKGGIFMEPTGEKIITQAKGVMQIKFSATGKSGHGSRPWDGVNALELLTSSLNKFRLKHPVPSQETRSTTFNFSIFQSGTTINQIPDKAIVWCDIRWNPKDNPKIIINELKSLFRNTKVEVVKLESPINCANDSTLVTSFSNSLKENRIRPIIGFEHGSSDARHCTAKNIPAIVFGPKGKNIHSDNEWVDLKSVVNVAKVLNCWISQLN